MCQTSLIQTPCLVLLKAIDDLGKLDSDHAAETESCIIVEVWALFSVVFLFYKLKFCNLFQLVGLLLLLNEEHYYWAFYLFISLIK